MDGVRYLQYRRDGGTDKPLRWEFGGIDGWDKVSAPGRVGKRVAEGLLQRPLAPEAAAPTNQTVHWGYGATWGAGYGLLAGSLHRPSPMLGPLFGSAVWMAGYLILPRLGLYKPIWKYDATTLSKDLGAHLAYGAATAAAFGLLR